MVLYTNWGGFDQDLPHEVVLFANWGGFNSDLSMRWFYLSIEVVLIQIYLLGWV